MPARTNCNDCRPLLFPPPAAGAPPWPLGPTIAGAVSLVLAEAVSVVFIVQTIPPVVLPLGLTRLGPTTLTLEEILGIGATWLPIMIYNSAIIYADRSTSKIRTTWGVWIDFFDLHICVLVAAPAKAW
jgi:hypothetical protein